MVDTNTVHQHWRNITSRHRQLGLFGCSLCCLRVIPKLDDTIPELTARTCNIMKWLQSQQEATGQLMDSSDLAAVNYIAHIALSSLCPLCSSSGDVWDPHGLTWVWADLSLGWLEFGLAWVRADSSLGWLEFGLTWVWADLSLGWLEFGLTWVWAGLSLGWLEFGLARVWADLGLGWLEFGLTWVWAGLSLGWLEFGLARVWADLSLGWLEFGLTWVWADLSLGWLEFGLARVWADLSLGWLEFGLTWLKIGAWSKKKPLDTFSVWQGYMGYTVNSGMW